MPTIPRTQGPTVEQRPTPIGPTNQPQPDAGLYAAPARQLGDFAQGLLRSGDQFAGLAQKMQETEDADSHFRREAALKEDLAKFQDGIRNRRGVDAWGATKDLEAWWDEATKRHGEGLTRDTQRRLFDQTVQKLRFSSVEGVREHERSERVRSVTTSVEASIAASTSLAAANFNDPGIIRTAKDDIAKRVAVVARLNGHDAATQETITAKHISNLHKQVLQNLAREKPTAAAAYFELNKGEIDGALHAELGKLAQEASSDAKGMAASDEVWQRLKPKADDAPTDYSAMEDAVRTATEGDPMARKIALQDLRERAAAHERSARERSEQNESKVWEAIIGGAGARDVRQLPEWASISGTRRERILNYMAQRANTEASRAAAFEARQDRAEARERDRLERNGRIRMYELSDPTVLAGMTRPQVIMEAERIGPENTGVLLNRWDALAKGGSKRLDEAKIDKQSFDAVAQEFGLRPHEKNKSEDDKIALGEAQQRVERAIAFEQQVKKRELTRDEKEQVMRRELMQKVQIERPFFFDKEKPFALTGAEERRRAYVTVDGKQVFLKNIPESAYSEVEAGLRERGLPAGPDAVVRFYIQHVNGGQLPDGRSARGQVPATR